MLKKQQQSAVTASGTASSRTPIAPPGFSDHRDGGNAHYVVSRQFVSGDAELVALKLGPDDSLRRGGGGLRESRSKSDMSDGVLTKSQARARRSVRHKCMQICADRLLTLTFRENVTDIKVAWGCLDYFHRLMRWRYGSDRYQFVVVPEYQKRGAVHFHLAIAGFYHVNTVRRLWLKAVGKLDGNIDIASRKSVGKNSLNPRRIGQYIAKYLSKNDSVAINKKRYASSKHIPEPNKITAYMVANAYPLWMLSDYFCQVLGRIPAVTTEVGESYYPFYYLST